MGADVLNVVIRADAGPGVGTGHVMRMLALGQACVRLGGSVTMAVGELPAGLVRRIETSGIEVRRLANDKACDRDAKETREVIRERSADWVVVDGYAFGSNYQRQLETNSSLMVMDDGNVDRDSPADLILNQNAFAKVPSWRMPANYLAGCRYTLLRSEFLSAAACQPKHIVKQARRLLVTFGGSDQQNWTATALKAIAVAGNKRTIVDAVVGAGCSSIESLMHLKRELPYTIRIHRNVDRMVDLMHGCDMAITAGGSTCYELARCGVPALAVAVADNQIPVVAELSRLNLLRRYDQGQSEDSLAGAVRMLMRDAESRAHFSLNGRKLVDGHGAFRIARRLANSGVNLRPATMADARQLFDWRNDPEVRSVSFQTGQISFDAHKVWLERKIDDTDCQLWIAEDRNGVPVGQVRLDLEFSDEATISISVDHARRAQGLGRVLIQKACRAAFEEMAALRSIVARIKPGNVASEKAFLGVGFKQVTPAMVSKKIANQYVLARETETPVKRVA